MFVFKQKNVVTEKAEQLSTFHVFICNKNLNMSVNVEKIFIDGKKSNVINYNNSRLSSD